MNVKIESPESTIPIDLKKDILSGTALRSGIKLQTVERDALLIWDEYLGWLSKNEHLGDTPSPLWGMEARDNYDIDIIQKALAKRKGPIKAVDLRRALKGKATDDSTQYRYKWRR